MTDDLPLADRSFAVEVHPDGTETTLALVGELDMYYVEELESVARRTLAAGSGRVRLDLRRLGFIDSSGLRILLALRNDAKRRGCDLVLVPGPPPVQRLFELSCTRGLFQWDEADGGAPAP